MLLHASCRSLLLLCVLLRSCQAVENDATERVFSHVSPAPAVELHSNASLNSARTGGRGQGGGAAAQERGGEWTGRMLCSFTATPTFCNNA